MKARCVQSAVPYSQTTLRGYAAEELYDTKLSKDEWYVLYGLWVEDGMLFYLVQMFDDVYYPLIMPAGCFSEPFGDMPPSFVTTYDPVAKIVIISSPMFRRSPYFYSELLDADWDGPLAKEWQDFRHYVDAFEIVQAHDKGRNST